MKRLAIILALVLILSACAEIPPPAETAPPLPPETLDATEMTLPPETTLPSETTEPQLQTTYYEELLSFDAEPNWLARSLGCIYEKPEDIDLYYMFYLGVEYPGSWNEICEESRQKLVGQGFIEDMDLQIMPAEILEEALLSTFGIDLMSVEMPRGWGYIVTEDAFCSNHSDAYFPGVPNITAVEDDGQNITIHYTIDGYWNTITEDFLDTAELVLSLIRNEDGTIHAVSNVLAS